MSWQNNFDDRQKAEIEFSKLYESRFNHGTDGHNAKLIIAKMALLLDRLEATTYQLKEEIESPKLPGEKKTIYLTHKLLEVFK